jgi:hypothetical protein
MVPQIARIAVLFAGAFCLAAAASAAETPSAGRGILVLRNGQSLEGNIRQEGNTFIVDLSDGQIRIKATDVELQCNSHEEGYRRKRAAIQVGNVHDHLELSQWCLRHDLLGPAAAELADAVAADPGHPMIPVIRERLKLAMEPPPMADVARKVQLGPSNEELDGLVRSLPHGVTESFTQSVQPLLMNHCMTSGCHGAQSSMPMHLLRVPSSRTVGRRVTQRNLYAVLQFIDRDNPGASRLLKAAGAPHGSVQYAIFNEHRAEQFQRLAEFAVQVSRQPPPSPRSATVAPATPAAEFGSIWEDAAIAPPQELPEDARQGRRLSTPDSSADGQAKTDAKKPGELAMKSTLAGSLPPDTFSRRYAEEKKKAPDAPKTPPQGEGPQDGVR